MKREERRWSQTNSPGTFIFTVHTFENIYEKSILFFFGMFPFWDNQCYFKCIFQMYFSNEYVYSIKFFIV